MRRLLLLAALAAALGAEAQLRSPLLNNNRFGANRPATGLPGRPGAAPNAAAPKPVEDLIQKTTNGMCRLNMVGAEIADVLNVYAQETGRTILPAPDLPKAQITLTSRDDLTKAEFLEAIEVILTMNGVTLEPRGEKFVRALPRKTVRVHGIPLQLNMPTNGLPERGHVVSQLIAFRNIEVSEAQKALEGFKDPNGLFQVFERTNAILVTDTQENINRMLEIAKAIDVATPVLEEVFYYQVKYAAASEIKTALETIVTESQKESKDQTAGPKLSGAPGFGRGMTTTTGPRLFNLNNRPGQQQPQPTPNETLLASVSDADRGMIRGKVLILADERSNKLIIITSKANWEFFKKVIETLDVETAPDVEVEVIRLKYADAEDVSEHINDLIGNNSASASKGSQNPNSAAGGQSGSLTPRPALGTPRAKSPANANPGSKVGELNKDNVKVLADKRINGVVVMARTQDMPTVKRIIDRMDVKLAQVLIETVIIEVSLGDDLKTGIDWVQRGWSEDGKKRDGMVNHNNYMLGGGGGQTAASGMLNTMMSVGTNVVSSAAWGGANPIGGGVNYLLKSDKLNLAAVIQASKSDNRAKYIASPVVMTVDNKEATIEATETRKFYSGSSASSSGYSSNYVSYNYSDKDLGIKIKVTPKINPNGTVLLEVEEEYSQLGAGQSVLVSSGNNGAPSSENIDTALTRKMSADILLENLQTVVMGGLTETRTTDKESGIPILKDIPWVGKWLFGSVSQEESRKELLVFMTPYVLDDGESAQLEAMRRKKALSDPRPWDDHGWSGSKLADPVSKKEQLRRFNDEWKRQDDERQTKLAIEKVKLDRAKKLKEMSQTEDKFWRELQEKEEQLEREKAAKKSEEEQLRLREALDGFKRQRMEKAEAEIRAAEAKEVGEMKGVKKVEEVGEEEAKAKVESKVEEEAPKVEPSAEPAKGEPAADAVEAEPGGERAKLDSAKDAAKPEPAAVEAEVAPARGAEKPHSLLGDLAPAADGERGVQ